MNTHRIAARRQRGVGLIELLVALLLLSVGLAGFIGLQASALKGATMAQHRAVAMQAATELAERVKAGVGTNADVQHYAVSASYADQQAARGTSPPPAPPTTCTAPADSCTVPQVAAADLHAWRRRLAELLPGAAVQATPQATDGTLDLVIAWRDPQLRVGEQPGPACSSGWLGGRTDLQCLALKVTR